MSVQMAFRLSDAEIAFLDSQIASGQASNRTEALRVSIAEAARQRQYRIDEQRVVAVVSLGESLYPDLEGIAGNYYPELD
jgi:Arc/MetJ-type ribon-helix-helix transcriptional regulator